jgi:hypothetical protein
VQHNPNANTSLVCTGPVGMPTVPRRRPHALGVVETPPPGLKARELFEQARAVSVELLCTLESAIATVRSLSDEVVAGGELYAPGLRELARRLSEDLFWTSKTLEQLSQRQGDGPTWVRTAHG